MTFSLEESECAYADLERTVYVLPADKITVLDDTVAISCGGIARTPASPQSGYQPRAYYGAPLEPFDGIWLGAGQDNDANFYDLVDVINGGEGEGENDRPALAMYYAALPVSQRLAAGEGEGEYEFQYEEACVSPSMIAYSALLGAESDLIPQIALPLQARLPGLGAEPDCGQDEVQKITIQTSEGTLDGNFTLSCPGLGIQTGDIEWDASASAVDAALEAPFQACPGVSKSQWRVEAGTATSTLREWYVTFEGELHQIDIPPEWSLEVDPEGLESVGTVTWSVEESQQGDALDPNFFPNQGVPVDIPLAMSDSELNAIGIDPAERQAILDEIVSMFSLIYESRTGGRPFFLRIGYEVNSPQNNYCPDRYKTAYRSIIQALREEGIEFASVWHVEAATQAWDWTAFYPGDEWVDWIGTSIFYADHLVEDEDNNKNQLAILDFAQAHNKPVIIAESSAINVGVAWCEGEGPLPTDPEVNCGDDQGAGEDAWELWFGPYFDHMRAHPQIKAISYINKDWSDPPIYVNWKKDAQLGSNSYVGGEFRSEIKPKSEDPIYRLETHVETELGGCQPLRIRTDGAEWLRFLPNGDLVITKGRARIYWTNWSATGPLESEPAFAIVNPEGRALLAVDPVNGDLFLRGAIYPQESSIEASGYYYETGAAEGEGEGEGDTVLMRLSPAGVMYLCGLLRSGIAPRSAQISDNPFPGSEDDYGDPICGDPQTRPDDCDCFEATTWWAPDACSYP